MMGRTHILFGLTLYSGLNLALGNQPTLSDQSFCLGLVALGSLLPDIDDPRSWIGRRLWPVSMSLSSITRHRGPTHCLLACLAVSICLAVIYWSYPKSALYYIAFGLGYFSHILGDFFTKEGVALFWPNKKRFRFPWAFRTNSLTEQVVAIILGFVLAGELYHSWRMLEWINFD
jgi:inner membrane protein